MAVSAVAGLMSAAGAAIGAAAAGTAFTIFGLSGLAAYATVFAIGAGLSMVSRALMPTPNIGQNLAGRSVTVRQPDVTRKIIYGQARVGGAIVYLVSTGPKNEYLHLVMTVAGHEIESFEEMWFNDDKVWDKDTGFADDYGDYVLFNRYLGNQTTVDPVLDAASAQWTSAHVLNGVAYAMVRLKYDVDQFAQGLPNISFVIKGKKVYNPITDVTEWTQNPALCVYDYLLDSRYGLAESPSNVNLAALTSAVNLCDQLVAESDNQTRYTLDGVVDSANSRKENIESMLSAMGGSLVYSGGQYFIAGSAYVAPTITIDESVMVGAITVSTRKSRRELYNGVKGVFLNAEENYTVSDYPAQISSDYAIADGDPVYLDMGLAFTTNQVRAQRLAKLALLKSRQQTTISVPCNLAALKFKAGDNINVTNTRLGWTNKPFQILGYTLNADSDGSIVVDVSAIETSPELYDWQSSDEKDYLSAGEVYIYDGKTTVAPSSVTATPYTFLAADGTVESGLDVSFPESNDAFVEYYRVEWRTGAEDWQSITTKLTSVQIANLESNVLYDVRVIAVNQLKVDSAPTYTTATTAVDVTPPALPSNLSAVGGLKQIVVTWDNPADTDFKHVQVFAHTSNSIPATPVALVDSESFVLGNLAAGDVRYFWLKSVDFTGNVSAATASISATVAQAATSDIQDEAVTFDKIDVDSIFANTAVINSITSNAIDVATLNANNISSTTSLTVGTGNNVGVISGEDATYRIWAGHASSASAPFTVRQDGHLSATGAEINGSITASTLILSDTTQGYNLTAQAVYGASVGLAALKPDVLNYIDEVAAEYSGNVAGDYQFVDATFDKTTAINTPIATITNFNHGYRDPVILVTVNANFFSPNTYSGTDLDVSFKVYRRLSSGGAWEQIDVAFTFTATWQYQPQNPAFTKNFYNLTGSYEKEDVGRIDTFNYDYKIEITNSPEFLEQLGTVVLSANEQGIAGTIDADTLGGQLPSYYASTSYVATAISDLVDSSPATLDTLNELAAALGDDPNFATTVSNSIGTKWTQDNTKISNWDTAYSWGDHASAGYYLASNPNGYTDDQTAAEILTAIKTVDGSGSGLDADLLDGQQGSYYAPNSSLGNYLPLTGGTLTGTLTSNSIISTSEYMSSSTFYNAGSYHILNNAGNGWHTAISRGNGDNFTVNALGGYQINGTTVIDSSRNLNVSTGASSGRFAVMSSSTHGTYDFYNNGTTYLNGSTIVDDALNLTGANAKLQISGTTVIDSSRNISNVPVIYGANGSTAIEMNNSTYLMLSDPEGRRGLYIGDSGDAGNYYDNTTHYFRDRSSTQLATLTYGAFNLKLGTAYQINGTTVIDSSRNLTNIGTIANPSIWINDGTSTGNFNENIRLYDTSQGVSTIVFGASAGSTSGAGRHAFVSYSDNLSFYYGGSLQEYKYNGYSLHTGSYRAPIFYDSNNTGFYLDPAGISNLSNIMLGGAAAPNLSSSAYFNAAFQVRESAFNGAGTDNYIQAPRLAFHWSGRVASQIGLQSSGRIAILDNPGSGYADFAARDILGDVSMRSPIYYDSANTNYYLDPASTSVLVSATFDGNITVGNASTASYITMGDSDQGSRVIHCNSDRIGFLNQAGSWGAWCDDNGYWRASLLFGESSTRSPIYYDYNDTGYYVDPNTTSRLGTVKANELFTSGQVRATGWWGQTTGGFTSHAAEIGASGTTAYLISYSRDADTYGQLNIEGAGITLTSTSTYVGTNYSFRAPIFYDSNDTGYYVDPNGTSNLNTLQANLITSQGFNIQRKLYAEGSTASAGWYRVAQRVGNSGRGAFTVTLFTTGGSYAPRELIITGHTDWSTNATIHSAVTNTGGTSWSQVRIVREGGNSYLEANFNLAITNLSLELDERAHAGWTLLSGALPAATGTESSLGIPVTLVEGLAMNGFINSPSGFVSTPNPWQTSNSAFFPNGITTANATNWIYGHTYLGGAPSNGSGHEARTTGTFISTADHHATLYYDYNDTGYYVDPNSTGLSLSSNGIVSSGTGVNGGFQNKTYTGGRNRIWSFGNADGYGISYFQGGPDYIGFHVSGTPTQAGSDFFVSSTGISQSSESSRAPIFYDSNNTAYFTDPANTNIAANLNGGLTIQSSHAGGNIVMNYDLSGAVEYKSNMVMFLSEPGLTHDGAGIGVNIAPNTPYYGRAINHGYGVYARFVKTGGSFEIWNTQGTAGTAGGQGAKRFWVEADGTTNTNASFRSSIFYDIDNTAYYVDPALTSNLEKINLSSGIIGAGITDQFTLNGKSQPHYGFNLSPGGGVPIGISGYYGISLATQGVERFTIKQNGSVGIGTSTPQSKLDVSLTNNQTASFGGTISAGTYAGLSFGYSEPGNSLYRHSAIVFERDDAAFGDARGNIHILNSPSGSASADLGDARLTILPSGNVGIGITAPSEKLHVTGNILASGNITAYSDRNLKENIEPILNAVEKVQQLNGVTYNRNDLEDTTKRYAGLIAQDVEKVLPEAVEGDDIKRVDYNATIGLLVEAIKELTAKVETLETKLAQKEQ